MDDAKYAVAASALALSLRSYNQLADTDLICFSTTSSINRFVSHFDFLI